jgi:hypothetical protein
VIWGSNLDDLRMKSGWSEVKLGWFEDEIWVIWGQIWWFEDEIGMIW